MQNCWLTMSVMEIATIVRMGGVVVIVVLHGLHGYMMNTNWKISVMIVRTTPSKALVRSAVIGLVENALISEATENT